MELGELIRARFLERINRFTCRVYLERKETKALLRNTGRLKELLIPGREVFLRRKQKGKLPYELVLVKLESTLVCVDSHLPPKLLVEHALVNSVPWTLRDYRYEVSVGSSRFDLLINGKVLVETKSVNLVKGSVALFPDAPTERGRKHIQELMALSGTYEPYVVFVIQRSDASSFSPNRETDPAFSDSLKAFWERGFPVKAFVCEVTLRDIHIKEEVPIKI